MTFTQLHYMLSQNCVGTKDIMSPPVQTFWGHMSPRLPHKLGPCVD